MKNYPITTNVETVNDGAESALFKQLFQMWTVKDQTHGLGKTHTKGKVGKCVFTFQMGQKWKASDKKLVIKYRFCDQNVVLAHITQEKFDASLMHVMPEVAAQERMVDNGTGQVEVSITPKPEWILKILYREKTDVIGKWSQLI